MAAKKSAAANRLRRNPSQSPPAQPVNFESLRRHIESERRCLTDAEAVLDCMIHAMEEDERLDGPGPSYPNVVRIVRGLVSCAIERLDSVYIRSALESEPHRLAPAQGCGGTAHVADQCDGVKECSVLYLH